MPCGSDEISVTVVADGQDSPLRMMCTFVCTSNDGDCHSNDQRSPQWLQSRQLELCGTFCLRSKRQCSYGMSSLCIRINRIIHSAIAATNSVERNAGEELLSELIRLIEPRRLIAIGNNASDTAHRLSSRQEVFKVRHPSFGGQAQFLREVQELYLAQN